MTKVLAIRSNGESQDVLCHTSAEQDGVTFVSERSCQLQDRDTKAFSTRDQNLFRNAGTKTNLSWELSKPDVSIIFYTLTLPTSSSLGGKLLEHSQLYLLYFHSISNSAGVQHSLPPSACVIFLLGTWSPGTPSPTLCIVSD